MALASSPHHLAAAFHNVCVDAFFFPALSAEESVYFSFLNNAMTAHQLTPTGLPGPRTDEDFQVLVSLAGFEAEL